MAMCLNKSVENELRSIAGNNVCCDCSDRNPQWASVSFGTFMCLECSGRHRALGVHISFVRSVSMDSWTDKQIQMMRVGGNQKCIEFLKQYGIPKDMPIPQKYNQPPALLYRDRVRAAAEGQPLPTELPRAGGTSSSGNLSRNTSGGSMAGMGGGSSGGGSGGGNTPTTPQGSDPLPGESEADYVARQRRLQEEARERMRAKFGGSSGLNSGGKFMAGVGSDPSYNPNASGGGGGSSSSLVDIDKIADLSKTAFSFLGNTVSEWSKAMTEPEDPNSARASAAASGGSSGDSWGMLASGVGGFWKAATSATEDIVSIVVDGDKYEENLSKFPRPPTQQQYSSNSSGGGGGGGALSSGSVPRGGAKSASGGGGVGDSWDEMDDKPMKRSQKKTGSKASLSNGSPYTSSGNLEGLSGGNSSSTTVAPADSGLRLKNPSHTSTGSLEGAAARKPPTPATGIGTPGRGPAAASPSGDDFFSTFGV